MAISAATLQTNMMAMNANRMFGINTKSMAKSNEKLSSGYRINRAADDAAGLAISEKLRFQIRGLNRGAENIQDGISLCQVADGALAEVDDLLHRANELAIKSSNGTNTDEDRQYIQEEIDQIVNEIDRIGAATTFNDVHIFDRGEIENKIGKITQLVSSPSAEAGRLAEAKFVSSYYYPSASIDFGSINSSNLNKLSDNYFSFNCSVGCDEAFKFVLKTDGTPSGYDPSTLGRSDTHLCYVDIRGCNSGTDVVNAIFSAASVFTPASVDTTASSVAAATGGTAVSHSNVLAKNGNKLELIGTGKPKGNELAAKNAFAGSSKYGRVDCSTLTNIWTPEPKYSFSIQCSSNSGDIETVQTRIMNAEFIGIKPIDVSSELGAHSAIDKVKNGMAYIAEMRSTFGAQQNRLEHSYNNNLNTSENEAAAESQIRDTDMSSEMVKFSLSNIVSQAGQAMIAQANQTPQGVLSLLQ